MDWAIKVGLMEWVQERDKMPVREGVGEQDMEESVRVHQVVEVWAMGLKPILPTWAVLAVQVEISMVAHLQEVPVEGLSTSM
jgi:hypothetical protein